MRLLKLFAQSMRRPKGIARKCTFRNTNELYPRARFDIEALSTRHVIDYVAHNQVDIGILDVPASVWTSKTRESSAACARSASSPKGPRQGESRVLQASPRCAPVPLAQHHIVALYCSVPIYASIAAAVDRGAPGPTASRISAGPRSPNR